MTTKLPLDRDQLAAAPATRRLLLGAMWLQERGRINAWRQSALGLAPLKGGPLAIIEAAGGDIPVPLMCTPHVVPGQVAPPDYPEFVQVGGVAVPMCSRMHVSVV